METEKVVIQITERNLETEVKTIRGANGPFNIKEQTAMINLGDEHRRITLTMDEFDQPYPVGDYELDLAKSLTVAEFGKLKLVRRPKLVPIS